MGINQQSLKAILAEHKHRPIEGKVLLIGRSTVCLDNFQLASIFAEYGLPAPSVKSYFAGTRHSNHGYTVDDRELIASLSPEIKQVDVLDMSAYEGANVICDLNYPVPDRLLNQYDFIYDSSVLDNVFNPASLVSNIAGMLKSRGRAIMLNVASFYPGALVSVHPEWFYGFFAINKFFDCKIYLTENTQPGINRFVYDTHLWLYGPHFTPDKCYDYLEAVRRASGIFHTIAVAEKSDRPTQSISDFIYPSNLQYIKSSGSHDWASPSYHNFDNARSLMKGSYLVDPVPPSPHLTDHYRYLGSGF